MSSAADSSVIAPGRGVTRVSVTDTDIVTRRINATARGAFSITESSSSRTTNLGDLAPATHITRGGGAHTKGGVYRGGSSAEVGAGCPGPAEAAPQLATSGEVSSPCSAA
jgi:hypothetical protein